MKKLFSGLLCVAISQPVWAAGVAGIGNATVNKNQLTLQVRDVYGTDGDGRNLDKRWRQRAMADYGFTDDFASGLYVQADRRDDKNVELEALISDSRVELTNVKDDGYYSGFRVRYTYRDADKKPDNLHVRAIAGIPVEAWEFRVNQIFYTDVGPDSRAGLGLDNRVQISYGYHPDHRVGLESFLDTGNLRSYDDYNHTSHDMGIVFTGKFSKRWSYEAGYARGITTSAPDHTIKLFIICTLPDLIG